MWSKSRTSKALVIVVCFLVVGVAGCGNTIGIHGGNTATRVSSAASIAIPAGVGTVNRLMSMGTTSTAFRVTSIDMTVTPISVSTWRCGSFIQVVYNAMFHVISGPNGGTIVFSYTLNNGRSQTPEKLTIIPGQHLSNFVFTWQGSLPPDHTFPGPGGVLVTNPNFIVSLMVFPVDRCR